ncbi:MAG: radical SAM protein [Flavobacterium sp.]|nr:radical SAM protein [Flavobacterium sp.]
MENKPDIVLCNIPFMSVAYAPAGTSLLKACLQKAGFSCTVKDYNIKLWNAQTDDNIIAELENYFTINAKVSEEIQLLINQYYKIIVDEILELDPRWVGFSVFTFQCQRATTEILKLLRPKFKNKIMIGGAGISTRGIASNNADYGDKLIKENLIDAYIKGDGDIVLVELVKGNMDYPGINGNPYEGVKDLDAIPLPDWSDVIDEPYRYHDQKILPITGSRGCVRHCSFCDIHEFWTKFKFRSGKNIANEMIQNFDKHGIKTFYFMDSLINGSMKAFRELCKALIDYYEESNLEDKFFRWGGQFIVRSKSQMTPKDFELASRSGCDNLCWGVESGSEEVRQHMQKGFSNEDLDYCMEQIYRVGMRCYFFIIVGYPTEKNKDFQDTMDMFTRFQKYAVEGTLYGVNLGGLTSLDDGTPLYKNAEKMGIVPIIPAEYAHGLNWHYPLNPISLEERILRRITLQEHCEKLGYAVWNGDMQLKRLKASYEKIKDGTYTD